MFLTNSYDYFIIHQSTLLLWEKWKVVWSNGKRTKVGIKRPELQRFGSGNNFLQLKAIKKPKGTSEASFVNLEKRDA